MHIGVGEAKFYGYRLTARGIEPAEANLDPIRKLVPPENRKEVRSLLGLFVQFRQFYARYDRIVKPIQKLLKKNATFEWGAEQQKALEALQVGILQPGVYLAVTDPNEPLILDRRQRRRVGRHPPADNQGAKAHYRHVV